MAIVNSRGSIYARSNGVSVSSTEVVFSFPDESFDRTFTAGMVYIDLAQEVPADAEGTLPIVFETNGQKLNVTTYGGGNLTKSNLPGTGVYPIWYDSRSNILQVTFGLM